MRIRDFVFYGALAIGSGIIGSGIEHVRMAKKLEIQNQYSQKTINDVRNKLTECKEELGKYTVMSEGRSWRLNPDLSVDITAIDGTRTLEWKPEYQRVFECVGRR